MEDSLATVLHLIKILTAPLATKNFRSPLTTFLRALHTEQTGHSMPNQPYISIFSKTLYNSRNLGIQNRLQMKFHNPHPHTRQFNPITADAT